MQVLKDDRFDHLYVRPTIASDSPTSLYLQGSGYAEKFFRKSFHLAFATVLRAPKTGCCAKAEDVDTGGSKCS